MSVETTEYNSNREVKSSAFTAFFSDPKNAAALFNALEHTDSIQAEDINFTYSIMASNPFHKKKH